MLDVSVPCDGRWGLNKSFHCFSKNLQNIFSKHQNICSAKHLLRIYLAQMFFSNIRAYLATNMFSNVKCKKREKNNIFVLVQLFSQGKTHDNKQLSCFINLHTYVKAVAQLEPIWLMTVIYHFFWKVWIENKWTINSKSEIRLSWSAPVGDPPITEGASGKIRHWHNPVPGTNIGFSWIRNNLINRKGRFPWSADGICWLRSAMMRTGAP